MNCVLIQAEALSLFLQRPGMSALCRRSIGAFGILSFIRVTNIVLRSVRSNADGSSSNHGGREPRSPLFRVSKHRNFFCGLREATC